MNDPTCFVTLVHGTWARRAAWVKDDAVFQSLLRHATGMDLRLHSFEWSGSNLQRARLEAAGRLAAHLEQQASNHPGAAQFVIGHSHGGSVALYAMLRNSLGKRITGVVCLSTPFISVRERLFGTLLWMPTTMAICIGAALALVTAWAIMLFQTSGDRPSILIPLSGFLLFVPYFVHWIRWGTPEFECERAFRTRSIKRYRLPKLNEDQLLILRVAGDEASAGLAAAQFVSRLSTLASGAPHDVTYATISRLEAYAKERARGNRVATALAALLKLGLQTLIFVGGAIAAVLMIPVCLLLIPFGADAALLGPFLDLSVEVAPPGSWTIKQFEPSRRTGGLYHSRIYRDPFVLDAIGRWITERAAAKIT